MNQNELQDGLNIICGNGSDSMGKSVLLFSGGMDSYSIAKLTSPDILLYCNIGLPEQMKEIQSINEMDLDGFNVVFDDRLYLRDQKLSNEIVPMRNLFFVMIGAYYGSHVMLGATAGDTTNDKDYEFADKTNEVLRHIFSNPNKNPSTIMGSKGFTVSLPYKDKTKSQIVKEYIDAKFSIRELVNTRSCYSSGEKECGVCRSCLRKFVAFASNGIDVSSHFETNPMTSIKSALDYAIAKNRGEEINEIKLAIKKMGG